jgi:hypothetical protein
MLSVRQTRDGASPAGVGEERAGHFHPMPSILARKSAGPHRRLELSRLVVDELRMEAPLTMRPPVMNERWEALAQEMRAVFAFDNEDE